MERSQICVICEINDTGSPEIAECDDCLREYISVRIPCDFGICHRCNEKPATFYEHPMEDDETTIYMACDECWTEHDKQFEVPK